MRWPLLDSIDRLFQLPLVQVSLVGTMRRFLQQAHIIGSAVDIVHFVRDPMWKFGVGQLTEDVVVLVCNLFPTCTTEGLVASMKYTRPSKRFLADLCRAWLRSHPAPLLDASYVSIP